MKGGKPRPARFQEGFDYHGAGKDEAYVLEVCFSSPLVTLLNTFLHMEMSGRRSKAF